MVTIFYPFINFQKRKTILFENPTPKQNFNFIVIWFIVKNEIQVKRDKEGKRVQDGNFRILIVNVV